MGSLVLGVLGGDSAAQSRNVGRESPVICARVRPRVTRTVAARLQQVVARFHAVEPAARPLQSRDL